VLAHILNAGVRALAASIVLGGILIYAVGGFEAPDVRPIGGVIVVGFFIFWIVFVFLFGPRVPKPEEHRPHSEADGSATPWARGRHRREDDEPGHHDGGASDGNGHRDDA
jgi:hypothetical protein